VVFRRRTDRTHRSRRGLNLSLLDFLDRRAPGARPILLEEITGAVLDEWVAGWGTNDLTSRQWRCVASGFFSWAQGRELIPRVPSFDEGERIKKGNRCGHLEDAQYDTLIETLPFHRYWKMPETYVARMRAFLDLGRWAGMALTDIIHFTPSLHLSADNVVSYQRRKTDEWAEVLLDPTVAARLRSIPPEPGSLADQPMNFAGRKMFSIEELWRRRFRMLCFRAGIRQIVTEDRAIRKPHPHMLRDTCAIDAISRGVDLVNVARMLGHKNVSMTQRCYLFWIEKRSKHCIEDQRVALARVKIAAPTAIERVIVRDYDTNRFQVHRSLTLPNSHR
jgi:integrase